MQRSLARAIAPWCSGPSVAGVWPPAVTRLGHRPAEVRSRGSSRRRYFSSPSHCALICLHSSRHGLRPDRVHCQSIVCAASLLCIKARASVSPRRLAVRYLLAERCNPKEENLSRSSCRRQRSCARRAALRYLNSKDVGGAEHVRAEDDPFVVRGKAHVRLQVIVMSGHIHEALGVEDAGLDEVG